MLAILTLIQDENSRSKLEELYHLYRKLMYYIAYDILKDYHEAEDVVQSAIVKIASNLDKITDVKCNKTRSFMVIIVRNTALNIYNQRKIKSTVPYEDIEDLLIDERIENPEQYVLRLDQGEWIAEQLAKLNPEYADILALKYMYEYKNHEIAELINCTEGNVRIRLYRARKAMQVILGGEKYGQTDQ